MGIGGSTGCCASNHSSGHGFAQPCSTAQPGRAERQPQLWDGGQFVQEGTSGAAAHLLLTVRLLAAGTSHLSLLLFDGHQEVAMLSLACGVPADRERPSGRAVGPLRHPQQQPTQPVPKPHHRTTVLSSSAHITASPPAPSCGTTVPLIPQQDETHCPDTVTPGQLHPTATHPTTPQLEGREPRRATVFRANMINFHFHQSHKIDEMAQGQHEPCEGEEIWMHVKSWMDPGWPHGSQHPPVTPHTWCESRSAQSPQPIG